MNILNAFNDINALIELTVRGGRDFFFGQHLTEEYEKLDEEEQKMFGRFDKAEQRLLRQFEKIDDEETILLCIINESPTLMARAVERARQLDLSLVDLYYILNVDTLEFEDRKHFAQMWVEQSNLAEAMVWVVVLAKKNPVQAGFKLFDLATSQFNQVNLKALALVASPIQAKARDLYEKHFGTLT